MEGEPGADVFSGGVDPDEVLSGGGCSPALDSTIGGGGCDAGAAADSDPPAGGGELVGIGFPSPSVLQGTVAVTSSVTVVVALSSSEQGSEVSPATEEEVTSPSEQGTVVVSSSVQVSVATPAVVVPVVECVSGRALLETLYLTATDVSVVKPHRETPYSDAWVENVMTWAPELAARPPSTA